MRFWNVGSAPALILASTSCAALAMPPPLPPFSVERPGAPECESPLPLAKCRQTKIPAPAVSPYPVPDCVIGAATLRVDGILELLLRAESDDGIVGQAFLVLEPTHADYSMWLTHLAPLQAGEARLVPCWGVD